MFLKRFLIISYLVFLPLTALAQDVNTPAANPMLNRLQSVGNGAGYAEATDLTFTQIIGTVINVALSLLGVVFVILIILAGYNWMTAQGDQEKITKAKDTIKAAIIGLIIVVGSFAIWRFISDYLIIGNGGGVNGVS
jgi:hypothetical protein